jgi:ankyrin repeat protein
VVSSVASRSAERPQTQCLYRTLLSVRAAVGSSVSNVCDASSLGALLIIIRPDEAEVRRLVTTRGGDGNAKAKNGWTLLHFASSLGKPEMMRTLVELGANLNAKGLNNGRPLHIAAGFRGGGEAVGGDGR